MGSRLDLGADMPAVDWAEGVFRRAPLFGPADYAPGAPAAMLADVRFRNALWLASPGFYGELEKLGFDAGRLDARKRLAVLKYMNRACFRPTPFGGFASFALAGWSDAPAGAGARGGSAAPLLHLLPGRELLERAAAALPPEPAEPLLANPTLYRSGGDFRYLFSGKEDSGKYAFVLNRLRAVPLLRVLLRWLGREVVTLADCCGFLELRSGCTAAEALDYALFLLREQVLLSRRLPGLLEDAAADVAASLAPGFWRENRRLVFDGLLSLPALAGALEAALPRELRDAGQGYFYTALERPAGDAVPASDRPVLAGAFTALRLLAPAPRLKRLEDFVQAFKARYDRGRVPLTEALDPDSGIAYGEAVRDLSPSPLLDGLAFPAAAAARLPQDWSAAHGLFFGLWLRDGRRDRYAPLVVPEEELAVLAGSYVPAAMPPSQAVLYRRSGGKLWVDSIGGASAVSLIGRFSAFSGAVLELARGVAEAEAAANAGVLFAEIGQLSDPHVDNINRRGRIYNYLLPVNSWAEVPQEERLEPNDLLLSVHGQELLLYSRRLGRRVVPRLPTAFNYNHNELPLFRLLCDLQHQGVLSDLPLDLELLFPGLGFYPRVEYNGAVLAAAKWKFGGAELAPLLSARRSLGRLHLFRQEHGLPAVVCLGLGDQQLVFDLAEDAEAHFFLDCLRGMEKVRLQEWPEAGTEQLVACLLKRGRTYAAMPVTAGGRRAGLRRSFAPGSGWLYLKLYCTPRSADELLLGVLAPFVAANRALLGCWFFIRYNEQGYHLRLRFQGEPQVLGGLMAELGRRLAVGHWAPLVQDYQADTYRRELERYGAAQMELAERCFAAGSDWVLAALAGFGGVPGAPGRDVLALALVWLLAGCFLGEGTERGVFFAEMAANFLASHGDDRALKRGMDEKYRSLRPALAGVLSAGFLTELAALPVTAALLCRTGELAAAVGKRGPAAGRQLLADLVHMQVNRLFRSGQLRYEAVLYHCLSKHAASLAAREREAG
jgi:thiopeptide-type bacteriocin biosynthesis protein